MNIVDKSYPILGSLSASAVERKFGEESRSTVAIVRGFYIYIQRAEHSLPTMRECSALSVHLSTKTDRSTQGCMGERWQRLLAGSSGGGMQRCLSLSQFIKAAIEKEAIIRQNFWRTT